MCLFTLIIHASETLSYAVRLAGIRTGLLAVSLSFTGMIVLVSRTSNLIQAPMAGDIIDQTAGKPISAATLSYVEEQFRIILGAASAGTLVAILLFPTFVFLSARIISRLEITGSLPQMLKHTVTVSNLKRAKRHIRFPHLEMLYRLRVGGIPKRLLLMNTIVTAIYTVGVLASLYTALLIPEQHTAATMSSGMINGLATIIFTLFVDPRIAIVTDRAIGGQIPKASMTKMFGLLMLSRFAGTILAQLLFIPAAYWLKWLLPFMP
ncbi:hypothetical protein D3C73_475000 [compost metagenome]